MWLKKVAHIHIYLVELDLFNLLSAFITMVLGFSTFMPILDTMRSKCFVETERRIGTFTVGNYLVLPSTPPPGSFSTTS